MTISISLSFSALSQLYQKSRPSSIEIRRRQGSPEQQRQPLTTPSSPFSCRRQQGRRPSPLLSLLPLKTELAHSDAPCVVSLYRSAVSAADKANCRRHPPSITLAENPPTPRWIFLLRSGSDKPRLRLTSLAPSSHRLNKAEPSFPGFPSLTRVAQHSSNKTRLPAQHQNSSSARSPPFSPFCSFSF